MTKKLNPAPSKRAKFNRAQLRDAFVEQMMVAVEKRGFVTELFKMLDEITDPDKKLRCAIELLKFSVPQLASSRIEMVQDEAPQVTKILFTPAIVPSIDPNKSKT